MFRSGAPQLGATLQREIFDRADLLRGGALWPGSRRSSRGFRPVGAGRTPRTGWSE